MSSTDDRIPCPDDMCTGTLNEKGICNYCGTSADGPRPAPEDTEVAAEETAATDEERIPCSDDSCTGTINERGLCNYCVTPHPGFRRP